MIQNYRYSTYAEHDGRIYSINLNYAGSEYTVFHDPANDANEFTKDLDFGWGTSADGTLVSPSGASYMQITSIPTTPSGWHGPTYVKQLDQPFRLYQLDEFSVIGEMIETTSSHMGKTYVALFDDMGNIVFSFMWGDAWAGSKKAYFYNNFYPQGGSGVYQFSGYSYSTTTWTGKLRWEAGQGGDGFIFSSIDGTTNSYP